MRRNLNAQTQPFNHMPIFNNWDVVVNGWYFVCQSIELRKNASRSLDICGRELIFSRDENGVVSARDGQRSYATEEKYGSIWTYPDTNAPYGVSDPPDHRGKSLVCRHGKPFVRECHFNVSCLNGVDPQHLRAVHGIQVDAYNISHREEQDGIFELEFKKTFATNTWMGRLQRFLLGSGDAFIVRYADSTIGFASGVREAHLFGNRKWQLPHINMIFAFRPLIKERKTLVQPIFISERRKGIFGLFISYFLVYSMKIVFSPLKDEDGVVLNTMRFNISSLLPIDAPIAKYIAHVNRLQPSIWSRHKSETSCNAT